MGHRGVHQSLQNHSGKGRRERFDFYAADVDNDGVISVTDVTLLVDYILNGGIIPNNHKGQFDDDPAVEPAEAPRHVLPIDDFDIPASGWDFPTSADGRR